MYHQESENSYCFSSTGCIQTVSLFGSTCIPEQGLVFHFVDSDNFQLSEARVTITLLVLPFFSAYLLMTACHKAVTRIKKD